MHLKRLLTLFCVTVCTFSSISYSYAQNDINQVDSYNRRQGRWVRTYPNGKTMYEAYFVDSKPVGELKRYYQNGKHKAIQRFVQGTDSCYTQLFTEDGLMAAQGLFINEKKEDSWQYYNANSKVILTETYSAGILNGQSSRFYNDGALLEVSSWKHGVQDGVYSKYYENGSLNLEMVYKDGVPHGKARYYYPNGRIRLEGVYKNGLRDGKWALFSEDGKLQKIATYKDGISDSEDKDFIEETKWLNSLESKKGTIPEPDESSIGR